MYRRIPFAVMTLAMVFLASLHVLGQKYSISGKIIDGRTAQGVANANISVAMSIYGTISGPSGEFSLEVDTLPASLVISHIAYRTQRIWVEEGNLSLVAMLQPEAQWLREVEVSDKTVPRPFFKDDKYAVLDYEVDQGLIYLLIYKFRLSRSEILCKSFSGDTVVPAMPLPFKPTRLFLDCLGYLHVLSKDSIYQVSLGKDALRITHRYDIERFHATLENCVAATGNYLYFRRPSIDKLTVDFFKVNKQTQKREYIASASDDVRLNMLYHNPMDYYYLMNETIPDGREGFVDYAWVRKILYKPNASVMCKVGDSLCVFNTANGALEIFDADGNFVSRGTIPIEMETKGTWTKEIYIDTRTKSVYTSFMKNGIMTLYELDLVSGRRHLVLNTYHPFPEKVRVHDHYLFYMYDISGEGDNKQLMKQKM